VGIAQSPNPTFKTPLSHLLSRHVLEYVSGPVNRLSAMTPSKSIHYLICIHACIHYARRRSLGNLLSPYYYNPCTNKLSLWGCATPTFSGRGEGGFCAVEIGQIVELIAATICDDHNAFDCVASAAI